MKKLSNEEITISVGSEELTVSRAATGPELVFAVHVPPGGVVLAEARLLAAEYRELLSCLDCSGPPVCAVGNRHSGIVLVNHSYGDQRCVTIAQHGVSVERTYLSPSERDALCDYLERRVAEVEW